MNKTYTDSDIYFEAFQVLFEEKNIETTIERLGTLGIDRIRAKEAVVQAHHDIKERVRLKALKGMAVGGVLLLVNAIAYALLGIYDYKYLFFVMLVLLVGAVQSIFCFGYGNDSFSVNPFDK